MQAVVYDGSFEGWLCAVFDVYYYKLTEVCIYPDYNFQNNIFKQAHVVTNNIQHAKRVWLGLEKKLSPEALEAIKRAFLSELKDIETTLLHYVQYAFASTKAVETDFSHPAVLAVTQTAKKVWKEKHRMEAFVRFQHTQDDLYYSIIEPDYNVLPLIASHFKNRYSDQRWLIYDVKRKYGIYFDIYQVTTVQINFSESSNGGKEVSFFYSDEELFYQQLWQRYFESVNISSRKNMKLHIQHMPTRYWKFLTEKKRV